MSFTDRYPNALWRDININPITLAGFGSNPDIITLAATGIEVVAFDGGTTIEELDAVFELQHDYKEGTDLSFHVHWYPTTAAAGDVNWQLTYAILGEGDVATTGTTIAAAESTNSTAWERISTSFADISGVGRSIGDQFHFRFFRDPTDGADTYGADAALATIGLHYQVDAGGSRQKIAKD